MRIFRNALRASWLLRERNRQIFRLYCVGVEFFDYASPWSHRGMNYWAININWDYPPGTPGELEDYPSKTQWRWAWKHVNSLIFPRRIQFNLLTHRVLHLDLRSAFKTQLQYVLGYEVELEWSLHSDYVIVNVTDVPRALVTKIPTPELEIVDGDYEELEPLEDWEKRVAAILGSDWQDELAAQRAKELTGRSANEFNHRESILDRKGSRRGNRKR